MQFNSSKLLAMKSLSRRMRLNRRPIRRNWVRVGAAGSLLAGVLLRRLDYALDVTGGKAGAAHYCFDHTDFAGIEFRGG